MPLTPFLNVLMVSLNENSFSFRRGFSTFDQDLFGSKEFFWRNYFKRRFLVIGGAGSIGQVATAEIFKRDPKVLYVVDLSENNMVELVRILRSTIGYGSGNFRTFAIDCGSSEFEVFLKNEGPYDYVLNLSAQKHVRSEKDPLHTNAYD